MEESSVPELLLCLQCRKLQAKDAFYRYPNNVPHHWCKTCVREKAVASQREFKLRAIEHKGGVCVDCGMMPHPAAMEFHHVEAAHKDFQISAVAQKRMSAQVIRELEKCVLVCRNCHAIRHANQWRWPVDRQGLEP